MTSRDNHFFNRVFVSGCVVLLFLKNVYTHPHKEFEFPKSFGTSKSHDEESIKPVIQTTAATVFKIENRSQASNINHMQDQITSLRSKLSEEDDSSESEEIFEEGQADQAKLFVQERNNVSPTPQIDAKFVFPTEDIPTNPSQKPLGPVPVCHGITFCERTHYYPEEIVNRAIQQNESIKYLANVDMQPDIVDRLGPGDETPLCLSTEQVIYPKSAESKSKEWLFVVNQENFKQGVRIETCSHENRECDIIDGLAGGYKTMCKQKYIYRQLASISESGSITPEMFRFPSSCCCHVKFTGNALTRMGLIGEQRSKTTPVKNRKK